MRHVIKMILLVMFGLWGPSNVHAQPEEIENEDGLDEEFALLQEEEKVFSAAKHQQEIADSPSSITIISKEQIENTHCNDVSCLLQQVPEIQVQQITPGYHAVGARAMSEPLSYKGLVLVDGQEMNNEIFGMPFYSSLPVHMEDIDRIEIIRGPGSALYGADAHSMVVSIITRKADQDRIEAFLGGGEQNRNSLNLRLDLVKGKWLLQTSGGLDTADHWRTRDKHERQIYRGLLKLERAWSSSSTSLNVAIYGGAAELWTTLGHMYLNHQNAQVMLQQKGEWWQARVFFIRRDGSFEFNLPLYYLGISMGSFPRQVPLASTNLDGDVQLNWSLIPDNLLISGVNYRWLTFSSRLINPPLVNQHSLGFYLQDEQRLWENLLLTAGIRFDLNSITPFTISPRLAAVWKASPTQHLRLAFGKASRKPTYFNSSMHLTGVKGNASFPELGEFFERSIGNEKLNNETISALEIGYRATFFENKMVFESDVFFNMYRDGIAAVSDIVSNSLGLPDLKKSTFIFTNGGQDVDSLGGSVSLTHWIRKKWRMSVNYTYRYSWYVTEPKTTGSALSRKGDRVEWEPAHLFNISLSYFFENGLRFGAAVHAHSWLREDHTKDGGLFSENISVYSPAVYSLSGFVSWHVDLAGKWMEMGLRAYNILNNGFRDGAMITRFDGKEIGNELQRRQVLLFLRAGF